MSDTALPKSTTQPTSLDEVDVCLARLNEIESIITRARVIQQTAITRTEARLAVVVDPLIEEREQLREIIATFATRRRRSLLRRFGKTVTLKHGSIKWRIVAKSLVAPKNPESVIAALLAMRGGKRYLKVEYSLDKRALAAADSGLLRRLGLRVTRHENLIIQANNEPKSTTLKHYPYPRVRTQKN